MKLGTTAAALATWAVEPPPVELEDEEDEEPEEAEDEVSESQVPVQTVFAVSKVMVPLNPDAQSQPVSPVLGEELSGQVMNPQATPVHCPLIQR